VSRPVTYLRPEAAASRRSRRVLAGVAVGVVLVLALSKVTSTDTWVHLSLGRWIVENGAVPRSNVLSYTQPDRPTIDHQWLFQVCLYALERGVGIDGVIVVKAVVVAAAFAAVLATARRKGADPAIACLTLVVAACAARFRFTVRPQVVAFLLFGAYLGLVERWRQDGSRLLAALLPLQVLWANLHGSAILGCGLLLACALAETARRLIARGRRDVMPRPRPPTDLALLWGIAALSVPATLANPNGVRLLTMPFTHAAAQAAYGLKELLQDRASLDWADLGSRHVFFAVLGVAGCFSVVVALMRRDVTEAGLVAGLAWASVRSERFIGLFAIAVAPIVASNVSIALGTRRTTSATAGPRRATSLGVAVAALLLTGSAGLWMLSRHQPPGLGLAPGLFPERETTWLHDHYKAARLFNEFEDGGYVYWHTRRPVFIDSRGMLAYAPEFFRAYVEAWNSPTRWHAMMARHSPSVALAHREPLKRMFRADPHWLEVAVAPASPDSRYSVFVRRAR